jgi:hypothetical protein
MMSYFDRPRRRKQSSARGKRFTARSADQNSASGELLSPIQIQKPQVFDNRISLLAE